MGAILYHVIIRLKLLSFSVCWLMRLISTVGTEEPRASEAF